MYTYRYLSEVSNNDDMDDSYFFRPHRISTGSVYNDPYRKTMNKKNFQGKKNNKMYKDHTGPFDGYNSATDPMTCGWMWASYPAAAAGVFASYSIL